MGSDGLEDSAIVEPGFYGVATVGSLLGEGVTGSRAATLDAILKTSPAGAAYQVPNEYICGRLGTAIGLPVPPGTIAHLDDETPAYVLLRFGPKGDKPPPADPDKVIADREWLAAGVVIFDSWILNTDRHERNLAYIPDSGLSIFDHGHALLGTEAAKAQEHLERHKDVPALGGCLAGKLTNADQLMKWAERVARVPDDLVTETCDAPYRLKAITRDEAKAAASVLNARKRRLWTYVEQNHGVFPGITEWGLSG